MARDLQQILTELNAVYDPQKQNYNNQIASLDPSMQAEEKGLQAAKEDAFSQITAGANRRGLLFSGIPLEEQARYTGTQYLPSVANLKSRYATQRFNLQDALAKITADQYNTAYGIRQKEIDSENAAAAARAAAGSGFSPSFGGFGGGQVLGASADNMNTPVASLTAYFDKQYNSAAGQNATRAQQLNWVRNWAQQMGYENEDPQYLLDTFLPASKYPQRAANPAQNVTPIGQQATGALNRALTTPSSTVLSNRGLPF